MGLFDSFKKKPVENANQPKKQTKGLARTCQDILDFHGITADGIITSKDFKQYSKLYKLIDSNFVTEPEEKQEEIIEAYSKFVNRFPDTVTLSIIIVNKRNTKEQMAASYHLKAAGDELDAYRSDYNSIIDAKIKEGHNDISKEKYILLTVHSSSLQQAQLDFQPIDIAAQDAIKGINKIGIKQLDAVERLSLMRKILNGNEGIPFEEEFSRYISVTRDGEGNEHSELDALALTKAGVSVKDLIAPQVIVKDKKSLQLGYNRFCQSYAYINLPQSLDTSFLTNTTNLPYEMVTVIQMKPVPKQKAMTLVRMQNTSIKADVIKASKEAYKSGYSPELMDENLKQAQAEAAQLREDIVNGGKKLFFASMVVTVFGKDEAELESICKQYTSKCADYTVTPSYLIGQQVEGLNTCILAGNSKIIIDRMMTSDSACAMFPFNIQELQDKGGHFYGINAISSNMIMYDRKRSRLANGLIFGQSGSGKSFITKGEIIPNLLDGTDDMIILDPENEYHIVAEKFGGVVINLETNSDYHINPCDMSMEWDDPKAAPLVEKSDYMVGLVESVLGRNKECNAYEVNVIHRCCKRMYEPYMEEMKRRHDDGDNRNIDTEICPTLQDFYKELTNDGSPEGTKLAMAMEQYCIGNYNIFAHHTNIRTGDRLTVFNLLYLPEKMTEMAMKVCLANIWTRIVRNREENEKNHTGKSIWVYLDEFHHFFKTESSASTIMAYFKRVRKYGGIMTGITQDVADLLRSQQGTAMFNNTGFFIFLNQSPVGRRQLRDLYNIPDSLLDYIKDKPSGIGLVYNNSVLIPLNYKLPKNSTIYDIMSTDPHDKAAKEAKRREAAKRAAEEGGDTEESTE
ncbi:MAG: DUF87 domain-containing protein [Firmicutes bacterium]|nr:DUF87 domain-containing protein [Bacillota bacterium]